MTSGRFLALSVSPHVRLRGWDRGPTHLASYDVGFKALEQLACSQDLNAAALSPHSHVQAGIPWKAVLPLQRGQEVDPGVVTSQRCGESPGHQLPHPGSPRRSFRERVLYE